MMVRKIVITSLVLCMVLMMIVGCGCSDNKETSNNSNNNETTNTQEAIGAGKKEDSEAGSDYTYDDFLKDKEAETATEINTDTIVGDNNDDNNNNNAETKAPTESGDSEVENQPSSEGETKPSTEGNTSSKPTQAPTQATTKPSSTTKPTSSSSGQLESKNNDVLESIADKWWGDETQNGIINTIITKTNTMCDFIDGHMGWKEYEGKPGWNAALAKNDNTIGTLTQGHKYEGQDWRTYPNLHSLSDANAEVRYAVYHQVQYNEGRTYPMYYKVIDKWLWIGHPRINNISAIILEDVSTKNIKYDKYIATIKATFISSGVKYKAYLTLSNVNGVDCYQLLDIEKG